jgi:RsiW-degrading membrane proteinase PrsW (M82 family)
MALVVALFYHMRRNIYHIILPAIMPIIFFAVAETPVEVLGCARRGIIAFLIALISGLAALGAAIMSIKGRVRKDEHSIWWVVSSLILTIPVIALLILA